MANSYLLFAAAAFTVPGWVVSVLLGVVMFGMGHNVSGAFVARMFAARDGASNAPASGNGVDQC